jgi:hypothetical protein
VPRLFVVILILVACAVAGCGTVSTTPPAPTPADFLGISSSIVRQGVAIQHPVSGDAGCSDATLSKTAISFSASGLDQPTPVPVHLYIFGSRESYDRLRSSVADCAHAYIVNANAAQVIEAPPFVVVGEGPWGPKFETAIRAGLVEAAGNGG